MRSAEKMGTVLFRLTLLACCAALVAPAVAAASSEVEFTPAAGFGAAKIQLLDKTGGNDVITVTESSVNFTFTGSTGLTVPAGNQCVVGGGGAVTCPKAPTLSFDLGPGDDRLTPVNVTTPILATGGPDKDTLSGGAGNDVLAGGDGNDTLIGNGGIDAFFGEGNDDTIDAFDGVAERISCGTGNDHARNDPIDIILECEAGLDGDGDGFASFVDCNDANPAINPGTVDILENGVDENCDGADARNLDRDGDGFPIPIDCNDANAAIHPGALEIRGNQVDENCDNLAKGFGLLRSLVSTNWQFGQTFIRLRALVVRNAPAGSRITVTCTGGGCPFKGTKRASVPRALKPVSLRRFFGNAKLKKNARVSVKITAREFVGRTYTYRIKLGELPDSRIVCTQPGEKKGKVCG